MFDSDEIEIKSYFKSNLLACRQAIDDDFKKFATLDTNGQRVSLLLSYPEAHELSLEVENCPVKDLESALKLKESGNKYFGYGNFLKALETYSSAILITPKKELGIFLANRSAALYNLTLFEEALSDANEAFKIGYPKELAYKLEERRARCHLALKNNSKAISSFQKTLTCLDDTKLSLKKKQKLEMDVRMMLAVMEKGKELNKSKDTKKSTAQNGSEKLKQSAPKRQVPKIPDCNPLYPNCSSSVEIRESPDVGRYGVATRDIEPGELLMVEKPINVVLLTEYRLTNCHYCFTKNIAPYPAACDTCAAVAYCSTKCRDADSTIHFNECSVLVPLWLSEASVTCLMAIKIIIQKPWSKLKALKEEFYKSRAGFKPSADHPYKGSDYVCCWSLVTHESERTIDDLFHRAYMAAWLLRVLKTSPYFPESVKTAPQEPLSEDELYVADLLCHHLQLLQYNTHEISEIIKPRGETNLAKCKSNFIGGGLFPTPALLNHSCNPGIIRYFVGTTMIVRAIRTIKKGAEVCDNYGPNFATVAESDRKRKLRLDYWFDCNCEACSQHWPLLSDINPKILRFKCETGETCGNVLHVNVDSNEFMCLCSKCGKSTNIMKSLKALQDTDALFKVASRYLEDGENSEALDTYLKILKIFDETLAHPIKDYYLCQQGVRLIMLSLGNTAVI
ncbi:SET and MYND domain-containing protein 4-like [Cotesia glomerata]|uniref:SET and MYND domain-containing protein 4-like n=1 Tax=Cotesia glomerata TaxID=32391 RepID=UPI001D019993|nr:SET and MYND domain-containing protein 4-like [Cotesia glomerata]